MLVRVDAGRGDLLRMGAEGIAVEEAVRAPGGGLQLVLSRSEFDRVRALGLRADVLDADVSRSYAARAQRAQATALAETRSRVAHFHLGSMGGNLTLDEVGAELDSMRRAYPSLISFRQAIGVTEENRTIWAVRITRNPDIDEAEPRVLFTALHHAREPGGMMTLLYTMWYLLEQYGINDEVTDILDHRELVFVPVVNPDGYAFNQFTNPGGGGMWRKNRHKNDDGSIGVDLNRNYGYKWGSDNFGSSQVAANEIFRGKSAFSEPETAALKDLCIARGFSLAVNYHSYANALIYPWGWNDTETADSVVFRRVAGLLTHANAYTPGTGMQTVGYITNGDADDWMYGEQVSKPRIYAMTMEVGGADDGFWPDPARVLPIADENLEANLRAARLAGECYGLEFLASEQKRDNDTVAVSVRPVNLGVHSLSSGISVQLTATNGTVLAPASLFLSASSTVPLAVRIKRAGGVADGVRIRLLADMLSTSGRFRDSVEVRAGVPAVVVSDIVDSARVAWSSVSTNTVSRWDTTGSRAYSGRLSYTDSPGGDYANNVSSVYTLKDPVPLTGTAAELRFRARWDIEPAYDIVYVELTSDGGTTWIPLNTQHMRHGSGAQGGKQAAGIPGFDRCQREWVEEIADLDPFAGSTVRIRFRMETDPNGQYDGIYVDDVRLLVYRGKATSVQSADVPLEIRLLQNFPNPFNGQTRIRFAFAAGGDPALAVPVTLTVYDMLGCERGVLLSAPLPSGVFDVPFDAARYPSGMYFYQLRCGTRVLTRPMVLLR